MRTFQIYIFIVQRSAEPNRNRLSSVIVHLDWLEDMIGFDFLQLLRLVVLLLFRVSVLVFPVGCLPLLQLFHSFGKTIKAPISEIDVQKLSSLYFRLCCGHGLDLRLGVGEVVRLYQEFLAKRLGVEVASLEI